MYAARPRQKVPVARLPSSLLPPSSSIPASGSGLVPVTIMAPQLDAAGGLSFGGEEQS
jgi:hypothetical protein